ncbi:MAG: energy transducer TonB [Desulforhopalus sp.]
MDDLKRLIFPAITAIVLHGFLVSFKLPKQQTLKPALKGNPIKIEINAFSPQANVPKKIEYKKEEIIPKEIYPRKAVQKEVITQPVVIPKQHKKTLIEPERKEKKVLIEERIEDIDLQKRHLEKQLSDNLDEDRLKEKKPILSIQKKAMPIYRQNKQPPYPVMAKRRGYEGEVLLSVWVDAGGVVAEIKIKHSSGHVSLDRAALKTVKNWSFTPATEGGRAVAMWVDVPIEFQLK